MRRVRDYRLIEKLLGCRPIISMRCFYLLDEPDNLWSFHPDDGIEDTTLQIHANLGSFKGKDAVNSAIKAFKWIFEHTNCPAIVARIDKEDAAARVIARKCMNLTSIDGETHNYEVTKDGIC